MAFSPKTNESDKVAEPTGGAGLVASAAHPHVRLEYETNISYGRTGLFGGCGERR